MRAPTSAIHPWFDNACATFAPHIAFGALKVGLPSPYLILNFGIECMGSTRSTSGEPNTLPHVELVEAYM